MSDVTLRRDAQVASDAPQAGQPIMQSATAATPPSFSIPGDNIVGQKPTVSKADDDAPNVDLSELERARQDAGKYRKQSRELEASLNELKAWKAEQERAAMSDAERRDADIKRHSALAAELQAKLEAREAENRRLLTDQAIITTATALREGDTPIQWHDLGIVLKLVDRDAIEYDDNGQPTNVTKLLKSLAKSSPFLVRSEAAAGPPTPNVSPTNPPRGGAGSLLTLADIGRMTPQQVAALPRETVAAAMSNGRQ